MLQLEEALQQMLAAIEPLPPERVDLAQAHGRIAAEELVSALELPRFDNSAMDGYAVHSKDIVGASPARPVTLHLSETVPAGSSPGRKLGDGECIRVFTGSPLPSGANAVVMQEDTRRTDDGAVLICDTARPGENVRFRGEDLRCGARIAEKGRRITSGTIGLLGACGNGSLLTGRQPRVGLIATGSELREPGSELPPGCIFESNRAMLTGLIRACGGIPRVYPLAPDTLEATEEALKSALTECDAIVTTGGVSVGEFDFVKDAWQRGGGSLDFWKVAIRPGKPFVFGVNRGRLLLGLPGNPVSAMVTFWLLARPALLRLQGAANTAPPSTRATLAEPLVNRGDRRHFMRVHINSRHEAALAGPQASHILSSLARAHGLVDVPPQTAFEAGSEVIVLLLD